MKLLVLHPQILAQPCAECRRFVYGANHRKLLRGGQPVVRPAAVPTPCGTCPKGNPRDGAGFDRHWADFAWLVRRRYEIQATAGACLTGAERSDHVLHHNLGVVDAVLRQCEAEALAQRATRLARQAKTNR